MDFELAAIALGDVVWISLAFVFGSLAKTAGLPPLVGFLVAGFVLNFQGFDAGATLEKLSDLGITLLLFTVGLKLNLRTLAQPQVWAVTAIHMAVVVMSFGLLIYGFAWLGASLFSELSLTKAMLVAFALSFSSTVFVVKVLEDRGEMASMHGRIAIGILVMQDFVAVIFLAVSIGKWPSIWAVLIVVLIPLRVVLLQLLQRVGHGELLVLYGFLLALGGAELFQLVGLKGDLGALVIGVLVASHPKAEELAKTMLSFKNLFLLGFFLSVGMSGQLSTHTLLVGAFLVPLVFLKATFFFALLAAFKLRARTSLLASLNLGNYSEFGLIVAAIGVANGWLSNDWLIVIAVALTLSIVVAAGFNNVAHNMYSQHRPFWRAWQTNERLPDDRLVDVDGATILIIGMGGIGTGVYDNIHSLKGEKVIGIDIDPRTVASHLADGRDVLLGDPSDSDFWDRVQSTHTVTLVMLALPKLTANLAILNELANAGYDGRVVANAKFSDEVQALKLAGANSVFNIYESAGAGFAAHAISLEAGRE